MHSLVRKVKRLDELWLVGPGWAWSDKPRQALTLRKGYLANYKLLTKKKSNTWPFQKGIRSVNSVPFNASIFVQPFSKFFCYPSKISCHYRQNFLFKIRSQYTWFSLFDYVQKCKKSPFITFLSLRVSPTRFLSARGCAQQPPKSDQICSLFSNMAQFPGRVKILKQYILSEMDTVENNIFTLNI